MVEPGSTAVALSFLAALLLASVVVTRLSSRLGVPAALLFIALGIASGSEGLGGIDFEDYGLTFRVGTIALVLILFDGGLNTPRTKLRRVVPAPAVLASLGVLLTALLMAVGARLLGFGWGEAFLLGAVVSSTDAAAVFSVLRGSGLHLRRRLSLTLELESGLNDPLAVVLTLATTEYLLSGQRPGFSAVGSVALEMGIGLGAGLILGRLGRLAMQRLVLSAGGLYSVVTLALALLAFGATTLVGGSGFMAVYVTGLVLGRSVIPYRAGVLRVHDALSWFSQIAMFLLLGLLVFPSRLAAVTWEGLLLALFLAFVARPVAVALCLWPFRFPWRETLFISWVGLRGAVPIILATFPVMAGLAGAERIFDLVFFVVVVNALVPGATVGWLLRRLRLEGGEPPLAPALLEVTSTHLLEGEILSFYIAPESAVAGESVGDLPFPEGAAAMLIVRGRQLIAPRGPTVMTPGDHVHIFCRPGDRALVTLLFGRSDEG